MNELKNKEIEWVLADHPEPGKAQALLSTVPGLHPVIAELLTRRGHFSFDAVREFFNPGLESIPDFGEMLNIQTATHRLESAIQKGEKILLYGDYDVDGTCSVAAMFLYLRQFSQNVIYYIPDRYLEGYGVSPQGIDHALAEGVQLMITLDCGITAVEELERATAKGVDVIVCDHHLPGETVPNVTAVLNPMQADCSFSGKVLCGCGVALMLMRSHAALSGNGDLWKEYLDFAAVATCSDIVPLTGINRILVSAGIATMHENLRPGFAALLKNARHEGIFHVEDVVFKIGPRINAAGRLSHAHLAVELLTETDPGRVEELAAQIEKLNVSRRELDRSITEEAIGKMLDQDPENLGSATVVHGDHWHKGVIGIVASRLIENCYRPTVVLMGDGPILTGSARSIAGFHLYDAIAQCGHLLEKFGGHASAAGLSVRRENLPAFTQAFEKAVEQQTLGEMPVPTLETDLEIRLADWYNDQYDKFRMQLHRLRPFGPGNMAPVFVSRNCLAAYPQVLKGAHLRFSVYQEGDFERKMAAIAFNQASHFEHMLNGGKFSVAYTIQETEWKGSRRVQLMVKAIAPQVD